MRPFFLLMVFLPVVPLLAACNLSKAPGKPCTYNDECGDGNACVDGGCKSVDCISSEDCDIQQYCSSKKFECEDGCKSDEDCIAGERCTDSNECKKYGCRDTQLDCPIGEFCDTTTGLCYEDDNNNCKSCEWLESETCAGGGVCAIWDLTEDNCSRDSDCDDGLVCGDFTLYGLGKVCYSSFCLQTCDSSDTDTCPRGYECAAVFEDDIKEYCYGDCAYLNQYGYARTSPAESRVPGLNRSPLKRQAAAWEQFSSESASALPSCAP